MSNKVAASEMFFFESITFGLFLEEDDFANKITMIETVNRAKQLLELNQLDEAENLLNNFLVEHTDDADAFFLAGQIAYRKQEWGSAINHYRKVLEIEPNYQGAQAQVDMANAILGYFTPDMFNP